MEQEEKDKETMNAQVENPESEDKDTKQEIVSETDGQEKTAVDETEVLKKELAEQKDKYLRLYSEFENFRRRTAKEKMDLLKTANEDALVSLLPILDDFERAMKSIQETKDIDAVKEGINLIYTKLLKTLESKGLKSMETKGKDFNPDLHEAITQVPAASEKLKGKVVDELEKGYYLNDKVIRFAKVIIGS
jgi:molecular chaperone GrpE